MKRKYLNTLAALALLAALWGSFTYWEKRKGREPSKTETAPQEKVFPLESRRVRSFTLKPREAEPITCRREGEKWAIIEPRRIPADQSGIDSFLNNLTGAAFDQILEPQPSNLKDFGLDPPATAVEVLTDAKPEKFTLLLGDETPTGGGVYAQVAGRPRVVILPSYLKSSFEKKLFDLRDRRVVTLDADQLLRIEVEAKGKRWTLVKNPEGMWNLRLPLPVRVDRFTASSLVDRLRNALMQSIVAEGKKNLGKYGFGAPELRLQASGAGGSQTLVVGKKDGECHFAMNSALQPVFTLEASFLTQLQKGPDDLRDKDLFSFSTFEVKRLEVQTSGGVRVFERQAENKWKQTAPAAKDVASDKLETLLYRLRDLRATSFPKGQNLAAFGLATPAFKFQVQFGDKQQTEIVEVSKVGDRVYARRSTDHGACEVSKTALDDVEKALKEL